MGTRLRTDMLIKPNKRPDFVYAGRSFFTIVSTRTKVRYTYRFRQSKSGPVYFVDLLRGPNNTSDYSFCGVVRDNKFYRGKSSRITQSAGGMIAIRWFVEHMESDLVEVYHIGRCGRCGKALTVPESIKSGFGPTCRKV